MALFEDVKNSIVYTGKQMARKTKDMTESMQLKSQISDEKATIDRLFKSIGQQVFDAASEDDEKRFFTEFASIRKSIRHKSDLEVMLSKLDGCVYCPECGARIDVHSKYCSRCGKKINKSKLDREVAVGTALETQMDGTKQEEEEAMFVNNEIESAASRITVDLDSLNH